MWYFVFDTLALEGMDSYYGFSNGTNFFLIGHTHKKMLSLSTYKDKGINTDIVRHFEGKRFSKISL